MAEEEFDRQLMCDEPEVIQTLINITSDMLINMRNLCETRAELTQHEIRILEVSCRRLSFVCLSVNRVFFLMSFQGKLVKLFSAQLNNKQKNPMRFNTPKLKNTPSLKQWLEVVGLSIRSVDVRTAGFLS